MPGVLGSRHLAMGQNPNRTPSEHPNPTTKIGSLKWVVHLAQKEIPLVWHHGHMDEQAEYRNIRLNQVAANAGRSEGLWQMLDISQCELEPKSADPQGRQTATCPKTSCPSVVVCAHGALTNSFGSNAKSTSVDLSAKARNSRSANQQIPSMLALFAAWQ